MIISIVAVIIAFVLGYAFAAATYQKIIQSYEALLNNILKIIIRSIDVGLEDDVDLKFLGNNKTKGMEG